MRDTSTIISLDRETRPTKQTNFWRRIGAVGQ
jgi:hypothetical protein